MSMLALLLNQSKLLKRTLKLTCISSRINRKFANLKIET